MSKYTIESDVPLTDAHPTKYPFDDMEVGQSFAEYGDDLKRIANRLRGAVAWYKTKEPSRKYSVHITSDGVRVWRIA